MDQECFKDILSKIFTDKTKLVVITLFSIYMASVKTINSYLIGKIVAKKKLWYLMFYIGLALSGFAITFFLDKYINQQVNEYSISFFSNFLNIFFSADFNKIIHHNEAVITKVNDTVTHIRYLTEAIYFSFFWRLIMIIISVIIFIFYLPSVSVVIIVTIVFIIIYLKYIMKALDKRWFNYINELHKFDKHFQNVMLNIWNIKYNSLEYITDKRLKRTFKIKTKALQDFKDLDFFIYKGPSLIFLITVILNLYLIIKNKSMNIGIRVFLILQVFQMSRYIENLSGILVDKYQNIRNIEKICPVWLIKPKNSKNIKIDKINRIEFKNVSYSFGDGVAVLHNFNLVISKNELISLSAASGKGKSTIINLICRLYDINKGEILINNINIKDIELESLRECISVVPQTIILFNTTVKENIIMDQRYNKKNFEYLVKLLNIPYINKKGQSLSYGQKQRVLIARALYNKNKSVYIFDECLSAVDRKTAKIINKYIIDFLEKKKKIGIFISHNKEFESMRGKLVKI